MTAILENILLFDISKRILSQLLKMINEQFERLGANDFDSIIPVIRRGGVPGRFAIPCGPKIAGISGKVIIDEITFDGSDCKR